MFFAKGSCLLAVFCMALSTFAQTIAPQQPPASSSPAVSTQASPAKVEMPSDPAALLALAAKMNGLQNVGTEPLHIKATYKLLDDKGEVKETGTFEEVRVTDKKYKLTYASPSFSQIDYSTEAGLFRVGNQAWPDTPLAAVCDGFFPNFPSSEIVSKSKISISERNIGPTKLMCVSLSALKPGSIDYPAVYCFNSTAPILRIVDTFQGANQSVFTAIGSARGAYFARDATFSQLGKQKVIVHLDLLDAVPHFEEATLTPPPAAVRIPKRVMIDAAVMGGKVIRKVAPEYPSVAKNKGIQGTVILQVVIGIRGKVTDIQTISGPSALQDAATDAVRQWVYQPYLLDGEPIEVVTRINVVFSLDVTPLGRIWF